MADLELKSNSMRIRFERGTAEPTDGQIFQFLKGKLGLKHDKLLAMYKDKQECSVIVKFKAESDLQLALRNHPASMEFSFDKYESAAVQLSPANAIIRYIRLFNLPPEIDDREIWSAMTKFGKVQRTVRERYGADTGFPIWTSVRGVYMELNEGVEIPGTVHIRNIRARVFYEGLVNKCFQCGSTNHLKADCPSKRSVNDRLLQDGGDGAGAAEENVQGQASKPTYSNITRNTWFKPRTSSLQSTLAGQGTSVEAEGGLTNLNLMFPNAQKPKRTVAKGVAAQPIQNEIVAAPNDAISDEATVVDATPVVDTALVAVMESEVEGQMDFTEASLKRGRNMETRGCSATSDVDTS